jgi:hypothetical protein
VLLDRLGWRLPGGGGAVSLARLTVKQATLLQLGELRQQRRALHSAFITDARGLPPDDAALEALQGTLERAWCTVRWENHHKETWWRLTVDGVPLVGNAHVRRPAPLCACGAPTAPVPRVHHFWLCPIAEAVIVEIAAVGGVAMDRQRLWLLEAPPALQQCVWDVVCLAAFAAMERGRRHANALATRGSHARPQLVAAACAAAVADFWGRLASFAAQGAAPRGWDDVPPTHPFVGVSPGDRQLVLNCPA